MSEILRRLSWTKKKQIPKVLFRFQPWSSNYSFTGNRLGCALAFALALALEVICLKINISAPFVWFYSELLLPLFLTQSLLYFSISADYRRCSTIPHPIPLHSILFHCTSSQSLFQYLFLFWNDTPPNPRAPILFQWTITTSNILHGKLHFLQQIAQPVFNITWKHKGRGSETEWVGVREKLFVWRDCLDTTIDFRADLIIFHTHQ